MFIRLVFFSVFIALISIYFNFAKYSQILTYIQNVFGGKSNVMLFTKDELKKYNGVGNPELYLAILGNVYNVTKGKNFYGPGQSYEFFVGRDASRSFVTGKFENEDGSDKVDDFNYQDLRSLNHWIKFYRKEYGMIGKMIGLYYDESGKPTPYRKKIKQLIKKAEDDDDDQLLEKRKFPPCNVEWDAEKGTRVWCTKKSGGIDRDWAGVPRQFYEAGSKTYRCACISEENEDLGNIKEYVDCDPTASSCFVPT